MLAKYDWEYNGTLDNLFSNNRKGVYLLIHRGRPSRIIYVGTTNNFSRRLEQHRQGMINGNRSIWRLKEDEDIYELMSYQGMSEKSKYKYYARLAKNGILWASTTLEYIEIKNDLSPKDDFEKNWKDYVQNSYMRRIETWICSMEEESKEKIIQLESQIQRALKKNFMIGSHIHNTGMSWLGKIEYLGDIYNYHFKFKRYPNLDIETIELLKNLTDSKVIKYYKQSYIKKKELKNEKLRLLKEVYEYAHTPWDLLENDIIYTCCRLGVSIEDIASNYLHRSPKEIQERIDFLSRYYNMSKRL